jgi:hypothetical protein
LVFISYLLFFLSIISPAHYTSGKALTITTVVGNARLNFCSRGGQTALPENTLANATFNPGRGQGILAAFSYARKPVGYRIGPFNGSGPALTRGF